MPELPPGYNGPEDHCGRCYQILPKASMIHQNGILVCPRCQTFKNVDSLKYEYTPEIEELPENEMFRNGVEEFES